MRKAVGTALVLECLAVGNPTPRARWLTRDRPVTFSPFYEVLTDGNLKIHSELLFSLKCFLLKYSIIGIKNIHSLDIFPQDILLSLNWKETGMSKFDKTFITHFYLLLLTLLRLHAGSLQDQILYVLLAPLSFSRKLVHH